MSRNKGKVGEREFARKCREYGFDARRGQQYNGIDGEDVVGLPGLHVEVKRTERLSLYEAMAQAKRDAKEKLPILAHRRNNCKWLIIMDFDDWMHLYREWEAGQEQSGVTVRIQKGAEA